jgi:hypothetical protein
VPGHRSAESRVPQGRPVEGHGSAQARNGPVGRLPEVSAVPMGPGRFSRLKPAVNCRPSVPENAHQQWGGSPHRTEHWLSVAEGNWVAERRFCLHSLAAEIPLKTVTQIRFQIVCCEIRVKQNDQRL